MARAPDFLFMFHLYIKESADACDTTLSNAWNITYFGCLCASDVGVVCCKDWNQLSVNGQ